MDDLYRENILDHYKHPKNFKILSSATHRAQQTVVSCGDDLIMQLSIVHDIVEAVGFQGRGCAISMASASMLTELVKNKSIQELQKLTKDDILEMLGIPLTPTRLKCALLSLEVLHKALQNIKDGKI